MWDPVYEHEHEWLVHRYDLATGNVLRFGARDVRKERTGIHAKIDININWVSLAWTNFNVERDEDRVRLANSAFKHLEADVFQLDRVEFSANMFKHALDLFCLGLWDHFVGQEMGGLMAGDINSPPAIPLIGDYVLKDAGSILFSPPGMGKSQTGLAMAVSCAWGRDSIWRLGDAWMPLIINVERSGRSMAGRLARINIALGLDPETPLPFLNARGKSLPDIYEAAKRTLKQEGCQWILYDSISRMGLGSLKEDDTANKSMDMLNALCGTWLALGHSPRADDNHAFGSQMFDAAADLTVQLRSQKSSLSRAMGVGLQVIKSNDTDTPPMGIHVFEFDQTGLTSIRRSRKGEFAELEANERIGLEDQIAELLLHRGEMSGSNIADELGKNRANIATLLSRSERFVIVHREKHAVFYGVRADAMEGR